MSRSGVAVTGGGPVNDTASIYPGGMASLDDVLPAPHFRERHGRVIAASPQAVWGALHELRLGDLALSRALMGIRLLPARLMGRERVSRIVDARLLDGGLVTVLASDPDNAVLGGGVMQPWRLTGGDEPPALDVPALQAFSEPGWVKVGFDFVLEPAGAGTRLTTETRITATDARTRARFCLYWLVVRAGSGLIRRDMLRAVARRAEAAA
jgi:hypothetical protein